MTERKNCGFVFLFVSQKKEKKLGSTTRWIHICQSNYRSDSGTARPTMHPVQLIPFSVIVRPLALPLFLHHPSALSAQREVKWFAWTERRGNRQQRSTAAVTRQVPDWISESISNRVQILCYSAEADFSLTSYIYTQIAVLSASYIW